MAGHGHDAGHGHHGDIGEDYNILTIVSVGVVGCLLCILVILWVRALYIRSDRWEWERKTARPPVAELVNYHTQQQLMLNSYEWTDAARGFVSVPVADAYPSVLQRLKSEQAAQRKQQEGLVVAEESAADVGSSSEHAEDGQEAETSNLADQAAGQHVEGQNDPTEDAEAGSQH